jgi:hypothetical protein
VMHMQRSLIAFFGVEPPVPDNEAGHRVGILANGNDARWQRTPGSGRGTFRELSFTRVISPGIVPGPGMNAAR